MILFLFLLSFFLVAVNKGSSNSGISKGALAGIVLGAVAGAVTIAAIISILIMKRHIKYQHTILRKRECKF